MRRSVQVINKLTALKARAKELLSQMIKAKQVIFRTGESTAQVLEDRPDLYDDICAKAAWFPTWWEFFSDDPAMEIRAESRMDQRASPLGEMSRRWRQQLAAGCTGAGNLV